MRGFLSLPSDKPARESRKRQYCRGVSNAHSISMGGMQRCSGNARVTTGREKSPCPHSRSGLLLAEEIEERVVTGGGDHEVFARVKSGMEVRAGPTN